MVINYTARVKLHCDVLWKITLKLYISKYGKIVFKIHRKHLYIFIRIKTLSTLSTSIH